MITQPMPPDDTDAQPGTLVWLCHHGHLLEILTEPMSARVRVIRETKPENEIATRLEWFRVVLHPERLPREIVAAHANRNAARVEWNAASAKWDAASAKQDAASAKQDAAWAERDAAWAEWYAASAEQDAAWANRDAARVEWNAARVEWDAACADHRPAIEALHREECPGCPWDGKTLVFPEENA